MCDNADFSFEVPTPEVVAKYSNTWNANPVAFAHVLMQVCEQFERLFEKHVTVIEHEGEEYGCDHCVVTRAGVTVEQVHDFCEQLSRLLEIERRASPLVRKLNPGFVEVPRGLFHSLLHRLRDAVKADLRGMALGRLDKAFSDFKSTSTSIADQIHLDTLGSTATASHSNEATPPQDAETVRQIIESKLKDQALLIFRFLVSGRKGWTSYETLKHQRDLWRNRPDPSEIEDSTVFEALKKLRSKLAQIDRTPVALTIEKMAKRTKLIEFPSEGA